MLKRGYLANRGFYASYAHKHNNLNGYCNAADEVFRLISRAIEKKQVEKKLEGPIAHSGFQRLT
jgi:capsule polysaccharide export protein KpsC/LpsZ